VALAGFPDLKIRPGAIFFVAEARSRAFNTFSSRSRDELAEVVAMREVEGRSNWVRMFINLGVYRAQYESIYIARAIYFLTVKRARDVNSYLQDVEFMKFDVSTTLGLV
jgi:hypothetical protein